MRTNLCPSMGHLYPMHYHVLKNVESLEGLKDVVKGFLDYKKILAEIPEPNQNTDAFQKTLEDFMYEEQVR